MNNSVKDIRIDDFDYDLPDERIAKYPVAERDHSQLLVWRDHRAERRRFYEITEYIGPGELLVYNNTRVIQARLHFHKATGAEIEIFCLEPHLPADYEQAFQAVGRSEWKCLVGNSKKWKEDELTADVMVGNRVVEIRAVRLPAEGIGMEHIVRFEWDDEELTFGRMLECFGELPIPPYLNRPTEESDKQTYQTVYSRIEGSVAAPTAGLHFTKDVLRELALNGVAEDEVTLHVGAGTFLPVKAETIGGHPMHRETISVRRETIKNIIAHLGRIVAVGTTSVRTLESLYYLGLRAMNNEAMEVEQWEPYERESDATVEQALMALLEYMERNHMATVEAETRIIIVPGFRFRVVDKLITNFHQPKSTLLLLISAFVGGDCWRDIYRFAMDNEFRFLSYGDSSLLYRG